MSQERIEEELAEVGREHAPRPGWQAGVWSRLAPAPRRSGPWLLAAVAAAGLAAAGGYELGRHQERQRVDGVVQAGRQKDAQDEARRAELEKELARVAALSDESTRLIASYEAAQDAADRQRIRAAIERVSAQRREAAAALKSLRDRPAVKAKCADPNDPLCGAR